MRVAYLVVLFALVACARSPVVGGDFRGPDAAADPGGAGDGSASGGSGSPSDANAAGNAGGGNAGGSGNGAGGGNGTGGAEAGASAGDGSSTSGGDGAASSGATQGQGNDAGACGSTDADLANCGACGNACPAGATSCTSGLCQFQGCTWKVFGGDDYLFCNSKIGQSWEASRSFCQALDMDLTVIETSEEDAFVADNSIDHWIGCTDLDVEGDWRWIEPGGARAGTLFWRGVANGVVQDGAFTHWSGTEPNGYLPGEHCGRMLSRAWWDDACTGDKGLVCEVVRPKL